MKCLSCGADNSPSQVKCSHCGSHLPTSAKSDKAAVFARIKASNQYVDRNSPERLAKLPKIGGLQKVFLQVFFVMFIGGSAFMALFMWGMAGVVGLVGFQVEGGMFAAFSLAPLLMSIVPIGFVVLGVFLFKKLKKKMDSLEDGPVETVLAVIIDKRTLVSGGGGNSSSHTGYYITCEAEDGARKEYQVWDGSMYGRLTADDAGVLYVRGGYGLDFDRVAA
jgi:hypothetical protein